MRRICGSKLCCNLLQRSKYWMLTNAMKPIFAVGEIRLSSVHDAVPIAAGGSGDGLADLVRFFQKIVIEPNSCEASTRHVGIDDLVWREGFFYSHRGEGGTHFRVRRAGAEGVEAVFVQEVGEEWAVILGIEL